MIAALLPPCKPPLVGCRCKRQHPVAFRRGALPSNGLVVATSGQADSTTPLDDRLGDWVDDGGIVWATWQSLSATPSLLHRASLLSANGTAGGPLRADDEAIDTALAILSTTDIAATPPPNSRVLLWAGDTPAVIEIPVGNGAIVVDFCSSNIGQLFGKMVHAFIGIDKPSAQLPLGCYNQPYWPSARRRHVT